MTQATYFGFQVLLENNPPFPTHPYPWRFSIRCPDGSHLRYGGIPNQCETEHSARMRAWYRCKWLSAGTYYTEHYGIGVGEAVSRIQARLTEDLLKPEYRGSDIPFYGHCYVASEVMWHLQKRQFPFMKPHCARDDDGIVHWWLEGVGEHYLPVEGKFFPERVNQLLRWDLTEEQYTSRGLTPPYERGRRAAFLTTKPSKRAMTLLRRLYENVDGGPQTTVPETPTG